MKPITVEYVNEHLNRAVRTITPEKADEIWNQPADRANGDEWYLEGTQRKKRHAGRVIRMLSSVAACLAVCFLAVYMTSFRVDSTIYLDVNPSISLQVNSNEKVIRSEAANPDGEIVMEDMDLKNTDLNVAINAILGSMVKHGYLAETKDVVLLSVQGSSEEKTASLRNRLSEEINVCLTSLVGSSTVFDQSVEDDDELEELASAYGITPGKAALLQKVVAVDPSLSYGDLMGLSMDDLYQYLSRLGIDLKDYVNYTGTPLDDEPDDDDFYEDDADDEDDRDDNDIDADDADDEDDRDDNDIDADDADDEDDRDDSDIDADDADDEDDRDDNDIDADDADDEDDWDDNDFDSDDDDDNDDDKNDDEDDSEEEDDLEDE